MKVILIATGMNYPCLIGALIRLLEEGYAFKEVTGFSSGAVIAGMLATDYKIDQELSKVCKAMLPVENKNMVRPSKLSYFFRSYWDSGKKVRRVLDQYMIKDIKESKIPINIGVFNNQSCQLEIFNQGNFEGQFSSLISAGWSLPVMFAPVKIKGKRYSDLSFRGCEYLEAASEESLIIKVVSKKVTPVHPLQDLDRLYATCSAGHVSKKFNCLFVETSYSPLDFNITKNDVDKMIGLGYETADNWLRRKR